MVDFAAPVAPLFVPGSRPDRFEKAEASGADAVVFDLEDAVAAADKDLARNAVIAHLRKVKSQPIVRINAVGTPWHQDDVRALSSFGGVAFMLPKAERAEDVASVVRETGTSTSVIALVETAFGLSRLSEILETSNVVMAAFGSVDFSLDIGSAHSQRALLAARSELVWRSRAARRLAPLDGVTTDLDDPTVLEGDLAHSVELGFGGKMAVHPRQVPAIRAAFLPSEEVILWAREVLEASAGGAAVRVCGQMVDLPVLEKARRILARATTSAARLP